VLHRRITLPRAAGTTLRESFIVTSIVLCSGGVDSAAIAVDLVSRGEDVELCFVDYSQPAAVAERRSVGLISEHLKRASAVVKLAGLDTPSVGEIAARNLMLIAIAAALRPSAQMVFIGLHAGTGYRDCSPAFVDLMQQVLDFHADGKCRLVAPFVRWSKADVVEFARELNLPFAITHSCEASAVPCGQCRSCLDREALLAS
jgi:7-cyano-7-deazaguanine synthase